ncbi:MAG: hypothetical protein R3B06_27755 [Kofleriaceae bacterium]
MTTTRSCDDPRIQRARACLAANDVDEARAILTAVAGGPPGAAWAAARVELAALDYGIGEYAPMRVWLAPVLATPSLDGVERALALCWSAHLSNATDEPIDLALLSEAIAGLETEEPYYAAVARMLRGHLALNARQLERAVIDFSAAVGLYERAGSAYGPAAARLALAGVAADRNDYARADYELSVGLDWVDRFPYVGVARLHKSKLVKRRDELAARRAAADQARGDSAPASPSPRTASTASVDDPRILRAQAHLATDDVDGARAIFTEVAGGPPGAAWAAARMELAAIEHRARDYAAMRGWLTPILDEPSLDRVQRAVALYWSALASEGLAEPVDPARLADAIADLEPDEPYLAAEARMLRGRLAHRGGQLERAVIDVSAAVGLFERADAPVGPAHARLALAEAAAARNELARADYELAAGLAWLARFPHDHAARRLEEQLGRRRDELTARRRATAP